MIKTLPMCLLYIVVHESGFEFVSVGQVLAFVGSAKACALHMHITGKNAVRRVEHVGRIDGSFDLASPHLARSLPYEASDERACVKFGLPAC